MKTNICVIKGCNEKRTKKTFMCFKHELDYEYEEMVKDSKLHCKDCGIKLPADWITPYCYGCL